MSQIGGPTEKREYPANKGQQGPARAQEQDPLRLETDTVELEYGAEFRFDGDLLCKACSGGFLLKAAYLETTLDILRGYERPSYLQELEDSLDPVSARVMYCCAAWDPVHDTLHGVCCRDALPVQSVCNIRHCLACAWLACAHSVAIA
eukprot:1160519-Pelagomonas_calceolata.AAC.5